LEKSREYKMIRKENETPEQRKLRKKKEREYYHKKRREKETPEQREARIRKELEKFKRKREKETTEQRKLRFKKINEHNNAILKSEKILTNIGQTKWYNLEELKKILIIDDPNDIRLLQLKLKQLIIKDLVEGKVEEGTKFWKKIASH